MKLFDAREVSALTRLRPEPCGEGVLGDGHTDESRTQAQYVGVVVFAREARRRGVVHQCGANARHLVRGDRDTNAAATHRDTKVRVTTDDTLSDLRAIIGVIDRIHRVSGAHVNDLMSPLSQSIDQNCLEFIPGVIRSERDFHITTLVVARRRLWSQHLFNLC
jgi:hypothetical protein